MDLSKHLLHLENRLLSRAVREDAAELARLIADDFVEFGASGGIWNKFDVLEALPQQAFAQRNVSQFTLKQLSEDSALVTYHCHTVAGGQRVPGTVCAVRCGGGRGAVADGFSSGHLLCPAVKPWRPVDSFREQARSHTDLQ
ncbi:nuclear transport factor 2 family protein [Pseudomonas parakoreensis]